MAAPTAQSILHVLAKPRLIALGRDVDVAVPPAATKDVQVRLIVASTPVGCVSANCCDVSVETS
jgi:hypothetical protein